MIYDSSTVVDGDCEDGKYCHVYKDDEGVSYSATLCLTDVESNRNSYYKMQLLVRDSAPNSFFVFKSWGRVGTGIGDKRTDSFSSLDDATREFDRVFSDISGNEWACRNNFKKRPGKHVLVDIDYSEIADVQQPLISPGSNTMLPRPIQELIRLVFNANSMENAVRSFDLDMKAIPLGKISKKQLTTASGVLRELEKLMDSSDLSEHAVLEASNRFYSLIPHATDMAVPPMLDSKEIIQKKVKLLDDLSNIAIAVKIMRSGLEDEYNDHIDPFDRLFFKLSCRISILNETSPDYKLIEKYLKNTQEDWNLQIQQIFAVKRDNEAAQFRAELGSRMLLWHGSGVSNFAGILSEGLRIAPPKVSHSGDTFGQGIYLADMVRRSITFCRVDNSGTALLLLCDVALGTVEEHIKSKGYNPLSKNSTAVKALGRTVPDPEDFYDHPAGFRIPFGKLRNSSKPCLLRYNEYIVYDEKQVQIKYLVRVRVTARPNK